MKKKVLKALKALRERKYAKRVVSVETFENLVENPQIEVKPTKKRASKKKEA